MKITKFTSVALATALAFSVIGTGGTPLSAHASKSCASYAHRYASANAPGTGLIGGAALGALGGALLGGMFSGSAGVGTGAAIGGGVGAVVGAHSPFSYRALYNAAYRRSIRG